MSILLTVLILAVLGGMIQIALRPRETEPVYQGRKLSFWLSDYLPGAKASPEQLQRDSAAVREIGTNAIPVLLRWISAKDGPLKHKIIVWIYEHPRVPFRVESAVDKQMMAASAFSILGRLQATSAVPALVEIVKQGGGTKTSGVGAQTFPIFAPGRA